MALWLWESRGGKFGDADERARLSEQGRQFWFMVPRSEMATDPEGSWRKCWVCHMTDNVCALSFGRGETWAFEPCFLL